ncbi:MAG: apolipoprotein N-acyltransferase [Balneolaceae bacterium]|nr:apolipoprotein N-acyltransferase [Balneolaceae bacterium]MBO6547151.1 apolipoprotein N-acyltransferase [Balneolaceae bacterium]MBO6647901.1 apolipoprotein N-acyltransferase [Balneolaceae bacterium]
MNKFLENKWALSITAGLLLGLSFPPVNLTFLSFPAFILLFLTADKSTSYKQAAYFSYAGFLIWNIATTYWLMMASVGAGVAAILANSVLMTIPLCLARFFDKRFSNPVLIALLQAAAWVSYEYLHHNWDLAWPWLAIGNAWSNQVSLIQFISITGHLGISFWVVFTSALAVQAFRFKTRFLAISTTVSLLLLPLVSLIYFGVTNPLETDSEPVSVTVIQPNHDSYEDYGGMSGVSEVLDSLFSITEKIRTDETELIVWPENAIDQATRIGNYVSTRIADSANSWNTNLLIGTGLMIVYDEEDLPITYRTSRNGTNYNIFNSTLFADSDGALTYYNKANLVPIVERTPFLDFFNRIDVFGWIDWGGIPNYGKGTTTDMLQTNSFTTPGLVCYDSVYPGWIREFVNNEADFITIITNDGWWGNSSGHHQHFAYARLRAIEFDRWVVRSANNGTSGIIRPDGTIEQKTEYWVRTGFNSSIPKRITRTLYARFGDWLSYLCLILVFGGWFYGRFFQKPISN